MIYSVGGEDHIPIRSAPAGCPGPACDIQLCTGPANLMKWKEYVNKFSTHPGELMQVQNQGLIFLFVAFFFFFHSEFLNQSVSLNFSAPTGC